MGFFKKIFKPVRKVLDKIVPNEIKPFLPYAAAAVPFLAPASFGMGASSGIMGLLKRGLVTGVLPNVASQLAQEGADDDINWLSAGTAGITGALSGAGAGDTLRGLTTAGRADTSGIGLSRVLDNRNWLTKAGDFGLTSLAKGADFLGGAASTLKNPGMNMETLKAASIPIIQGTGDAMAFEAESAMREYEKALAAYNAEQGEMGTDAGRREAILTAMRAYNHPEDLIESTLEELGLRDGGRVAYNMGGRIGFAEKGFVEDTETMIGEIAKVMFRLTPPGMAMFGMDKAMELYEGLDDDGKEKVKEFGLRFAGVPGLAVSAGKSIYDLFGNKEEKATGGRVGLEWGGIPAAVQAVKDKTYKEDMALLEMDIDWVSLAQEFEETFKRPHQNDKELFDFYRDKYGADGIAQRTEIEEKFTETAANGGIMAGRKPFVSGGIGKGLMKLIGKGDDAVDIAKQTETFREGPITAKFMETVDESVISPAIRTRDMGGSGGYGMYKNFREMPAGLQAAELISRIKKADGTIDYKAAEIFIGRKLKGNETIDELIAMVVRPQNIADQMTKIKKTSDQLGEAMTEYENIYKPKRADGGIMNYNMGGSVLPNGIEVDYRGGGFIPMGSKERADDVPARVSKNEFVMTADAVRAAGGGSVQQGAKKMYDLMNNLEARA